MPLYLGNQLTYSIYFIQTNNQLIHKGATAMGKEKEFETIKKYILNIFKHSVSTLRSIK